MGLEESVAHFPNFVHVNSRSLYTADRQMVVVGRGARHTSRNKGGKIVQGNCWGGGYVQREMSRYVTVSVNFIMSMLAGLILVLETLFARNKNWVRKNDRRATAQPFPGSTTDFIFTRISTNWTYSQIFYTFLDKFTILSYSRSSELFKNINLYKTKLQLLI